MSELYDVAIVGTGFSGLAMAYYLDRAGIRSFVLLEKADRVGGTWRENTYPGAACDVPSHLYSFSFELNGDWTRAFSPQGEILAYLERCARKLGALERTRFGFCVDGASFDEASATWTVHAKDGRRVRARSLVLGNGALSLPSLPAIEGRERFEGTSFHSASWRHDYDLRGKRVGVIGTGASAIQFVPRIQPLVKELHLFQRTPPWIMPKLDREHGGLERKLLVRSSAMRHLYRALIYAQLEWRAYGFVVDQRVLKVGEVFARRYLRQSVRDPALRAELTPRYRMGCKRILLSNDYYPALQNANVELVTRPIEAIVPRGVRTAGGREHQLDAIIYGTGFSPTEYLSPIRILGAGGRELNETWQHAPEAYLGITVAGFPNLFLMMGPNTGLGHNSMIFMIEAQARYATQAIQAMQQSKLRSMDVRPDVQAELNAVLREKMKKTVWASGCVSWYMAKDGTNPTLWPGFTVDYWLRTRKLRLDDYALRT